MKNIVAISAFILLGLATSFYIGFGFERENKIAAVDHEVEGLNEKITLKFSYVVAEDTPKGKAARHFSQAVKEKTDGWVEVQVFPNGMLYEAQEEFEALQNNDVHLIAPAFSEIVVHDKKWMVMDMPFAFQDEEMVAEAFDGRIGELLFNSIADKSYKGLAFWDNGFKQITNNVRPIKQPEDMEGLSVRVMPSEMLRATYHQLGARPKAYPFNDVYSLLNNNEVDGTENTLSNIYSKGFYQEQKYMTISNHNYLGYAVLANESFWEGLPVEHQQAIEEAMQETTEWLRTHAKSLNEEKLTQMQDLNEFDIYEMSEKERQTWHEALSPLYEQYEQNIGKELMGEWKKLQK